MHELAHEFTNRKISPWGGLKFFQQVYVRSGVSDKLDELDLPEPGSNRGYSAKDLIEGFMTSVVLGTRRLEHSGLLRTDAVIQEIFGWQRGMASASTFSRFFARFDIARNDAVFPELMKFIMSLVPVRRKTIDIDSTVVTRYGHQEAAEVGYNPTKRGRRSHHPLIAFCDETKMIVNAWMRSGDSASSTDTIDFIKELYKIVEPNEIGLIRADAGFYDNKILSHLEQSEPAVQYIVKADKTKALMSRILQVKRWYHSDKVFAESSYAEFMYKGSNWKTERRIVVVRVPKKQSQSETAKVKSKQADLFPELANIADYEYMAYVTNATESEVAVHARYNQRGDCESQIKELKYDYAIDGFALQQFAAMEAAFRLIMVAYNWMQIFKQSVMTSKHLPQLRTVRFQCIAIGSYVVTGGRNTTLKLAPEGKRRHFVDHMF